MRIIHALVAAAFLVITSLGARADPPNIIIILTDDAGYADFGFTGDPEFPTPNIDRLAASGVVCTQAYVSASVCSPSRAGLLTGRYQQRFGHEFNLPGLSTPETGGMALDQRTIADELRDLGYHTGAIGKWHLGIEQRYHPLNRGFDEFYGYLGGSRSYFAYTDSPRRANRALRNNTEEPDPTDSYVTDTLGKEAVAFINRNTDRPFFLYLAFTAVHSPMHATPQDLERFPEITPKRRRTLAAMTAALDRAVGDIIAALEKQGLRENTLIVFLNDNGGATTNASNNGRYRGMKGSKFEGGIRVPFAISWPGTIEPNQCFDDPIISLDTLPTCLAATGVPLKNEVKTDGVDLLPFMLSREKGQPHDALFWRRGVAAAVRKGPWKLIRVETNPIMLFNIADDPSETTNVAAANPVIVAELRALLEDWEQGLAEPAWHQAQVWSNNQINKHKPDVRTRQQERRIP
jgi:arylsulfatase A-like enzyme